MERAWNLGGQLGGVPVQFAICRCRTDFTTMFLELHPTEGCSSNVFSLAEKREKKKGPALRVFCWEVLDKITEGLFCLLHL